MIETLMVFTVVACSSSICSKDWRSLGDFGRDVDAGRYVSFL